MARRSKLLQAARAGDCQAQFDLACECDFQPPRNRKRAIHWYRQAARQGHAKAQNLLGESYRDGWTVRRNQAAAERWFRLAADNGNVDAQLSLGVAYFYGQGVKKNWSQALHWYRQAAHQGDARAQFNLGHMYRLGEGVRQSWQSAICCYQIAADCEHVGALHWLARIYGGRTDYPADLEQEILWLKRAAMAGDAQSQCNLGVQYFNGRGVIESKRIAVVFYRLAAQAGDEWACYLLGLCYLEGKGVRRNRRSARSWLQRAERKSVKEAADVLREMDRKPEP